MFECLAFVGGHSEPPRVPKPRGERSNPSEAVASAFASPFYSILRREDRDEESCNSERNALRIGVFTVTVNGHRRQSVLYFSEGARGNRGQETGLESPGPTSRARIRFAKPFGNPSCFHVRSAISSPLLIISHFTALIHRSSDSRMRRPIDSRSESTNTCADPCAAAVGDSLNNSAGTGRSIQRQ